MTCTLGVDEGVRSAAIGVLAPYSDESGLCSSGASGHPRVWGRDVASQTCISAPWAADVQAIMSQPWQLERSDGAGFLDVCGTETRDDDVRPAEDCHPGRWPLDPGQRRHRTLRELRQLRDGRARGGVARDGLPKAAEVFDELKQLGRRLELDQQRVCRGLPQRDQARKKGLGRVEAHDADHRLFDVEGVREALETERLEMLTTPAALRTKMTKYRVLQAFDQSVHPGVWIYEEGDRPMLKEPWISEPPVAAGVQPMDVDEPQPGL